MTKKGNHFFFYKGNDADNSSSKMLSSLKQGVRVMEVLCHTSPCRFCNSSDLLQLMTEFVLHQFLLTHYHNLPPKGSHIPSPVGSKILCIK